MGSRSHDQEKLIGLSYLEGFVSAVAWRYGFRTRDYDVRWDDGGFQPSRELHELTIVAADGRTSIAHIEDHALRQQNAWKYMREVEEAFAKLARRKANRGL